MERSQLIIVGAGIAGLRTALQLLRQGWPVTLLDRHPEERVGGLGRMAFGGMALHSTKEQRWWGIDDSAQIMLKDWLEFSELNPQDHWPRRWAEHYVERCIPDVYEDVQSLGLRFMPAVNWVERGLYRPGNSLPRYHVLWGTGLGLVTALWRALAPYVEQKRLRCIWQAHVLALLQTSSGWQLSVRRQEQLMHLETDILVLASGGWTGSLEQVRRRWSGAPKDMLNGSHPYCDGALQDQLSSQGAATAHRADMWNYAAGIAHPRPEFPEHGLSLIPPKSALWLDYQGQRLGPEPWVAGFDTYALCQRMAALPVPWTWQILNRKMVLKELAISGAEHNPAIRDSNKFRFARELLLGNRWLYSELLKSPDVLSADSLPELVQQMNQLTQAEHVRLDLVEQILDQWDSQVGRAPQFWNDDQLRRIEQLRRWRTERLRTCAPAPLRSASAGPLVAMRLRLVTRKSLGGLVSNLACQVLTVDGTPMERVYAVGECAGFGGGGTSGQRSLEGTFISGCLLTALQVARHLGSVT